MDRLHLKSENDVFVPKEGQRGFACSNRKSLRCPSFGINPNQTSEDVALNYLAGILVEAFLEKKENEYNNHNNPKELGDILPSLDQGTS